MRARVVDHMSKPGGQIAGETAAKTSGPAASYASADIYHSGFCWVARQHRGRGAGSVWVVCVIVDSPFLVYRIHHVIHARARERT